MLKSHYLVVFSILFYEVCLQKQPSSGILTKRCSENIQQIYRRTPMPKCDLQSNFIEITLWYVCCPVNLLHVFRTPFLRSTSGGNTPGQLLLYFTINSSWTSKNLRKMNRPLMTFLLRVISGVTLIRALTFCMALKFQIIIYYETKKFLFNFGISFTNLYLWLSVGIFRPCSYISRPCDSQKKETCKS